MGYQKLTQNIINSNSLTITTDDSNVSIDDPVLLMNDEFTVWSIGGNQQLVYPNINCISTKGDDEEALNFLQKKLQNMRNLEGLKCSIPKSCFVEKDGDILPGVIIPTIEAFEKTDIHLLTSSILYQNFWIGNFLKEGVEGVEAWASVFENFIKDLVKLNNLEVMKSGWIVCPPEKMSVLINYEVRWMGLFGNKIPKNTKIYSPDKVTPEILKVVIMCWK